MVNGLLVWRYRHSNGTHVSRLPRRRMCELRLMHRVPGEGAMWVVGAVWGMRVPEPVGVLAAVAFGTKRADERRGRRCSPHVLVLNLSCHFEENVSWFFMKWKAIATRRTDMLHARIEAQRERQKEFDCNERKVCSSECQNVKRELLKWKGKIGRMGKESYPVLQRKRSY